MFTTRTAIHAHICTKCGGPIAQGAAYVDERRASEPGRAFRFHLRCLPTPSRTSAENDEQDDLSFREGWAGHKEWLT